MSEEAFEKLSEPMELEKLQGYMYGEQENNGWGEVMVRIPLDYYLDKDWCEYMEKNYFEAGFVTWLSIFEKKTNRWNYYADCILIMCTAAVFVRSSMFFLLSPTNGCQ